MTVRDEGSWSAAVEPLIWGRALLSITDEHDALRKPGWGVFDRGYEYETYHAAVSALYALTGPNTEPEDGWTRAYPPRFRRRPDGRPESEYVAP